MTTSISLPTLGWKPFFQQQLSLEEWESSIPARVIAQHRNQLVMQSEHGDFSLPVTSSMPIITVGDWLLVDSDNKFIRLLDRKSIFSRKAAGSKLDEQLISANVDTLFIVCSLNHDFNLSRIERYLTIANEAGVEIVIVLSKADCCDEPETYIQQVQALDPLLMVVAINGLDSLSTSQLAPWCKAGDTLALLGSSGAGKSTLVNTLLGGHEQTTGSIREDDSKGRHTTTSRSLHIIQDATIGTGGLLLDTPGMRELQLVACEEGISTTFADITSLAEQCRFSDCQHNNEPGCQVQAAITEGTIDQRRLNNFLKLQREQAINGASIAEKRAHGRELSKMYRSVQTESRRRKKGD
ncbi:GTPase RsgA [Photobacterium jeanii]|uniref:Small ribosomal subunit biogenesis GTPase RsgA n=1 Tax=Photobacterium jeanii TaxID=858640 RepID=A0A178KKH8_9GAMM|nr:ribosome small subunit-dependent GTPase A [Photobacterium jeanii]OAN17767.1 GTPase RsgA [Photobacterium jeanii]PST92568.1 ribosome small subunit-dependent GTPase A [Photobacterium jeanii]